MNFTKTATLAIATVLTAGCTAMILPTSRDELQSNSYPPQTSKISVEYVTAYANLKQMYERCLVNPPYGISAELDRKSKTASIFFHTAHGALISRTSISEVDAGVTEVAYLRAKSKVTIREFSTETLQELLSRELTWATGSAKRC